MLRKNMQGDKEEGTGLDGGREEDRIGLKRRRTLDRTEENGLDKRDEYEQFGWRTREVSENEWVRRGRVRLDRRECWGLTVHWSHVSPTSPSHPR